MNTGDYVLRALRQIEDSAASSIWDAHSGCAVIAGALLLDEHLVHDSAHPLIVAELESLLPPPHASRTESSVMTRDTFARRLLAELVVDADTPKELGHDVIYTAYVLRALDHFNILPWSTLCDQLIHLVRQIKAATPGWISINGENVRRPLTLESPVVETDYWTIFAGFERSASMEAGDMQLGHLLTHGHAIAMMQNWAERTLLDHFHTAYRKRLHGLRLANNEQRIHTSFPHQTMDPRLPEYWRHATTLGNMHGHMLKYAYSFLSLMSTCARAPHESDLQAFGRILWPA